MKQYNTHCHMILLIIEELIHAWYRGMECDGEITLLAWCVSHLAIGCEGG